MATADRECSAAVAPDRPICIIVGLSGAGKSTALRVFEDLGYFAIGGLPAELTPDIASMLQNSALERYPGVAIAPDMRQEGFVENFEKYLGQLSDCHPRVIFLEASDDALMRRYASTRRPHPQEAHERGLMSAIQAERENLAPLRNRADLVLDSTDWSIHDLRRNLQRSILASSSARLLRVYVISFGFKYGIPGDADFVLDLRFLDNPYFVADLAPLCGLDKPVRDYVFAQPAAREYKSRILALLRLALPLMENEGRYRATVALGCTGGRHRSVAMAEAIAHSVAQMGFPVAVEHRTLDRDQV